MTADILILGAASLTLLGACWWVYGDVLDREAMDRELDRDALVAARMEAAFCDDRTCDVCHEDSVVREIVALYDDAVMACVPCAEHIKARRGRQEAA